MKSPRSNLASRYSVAFILCLTSLMILMASALSVSPNSSTASLTPSSSPSLSPSGARVGATATPAGGPITRSVASPPPLSPFAAGLTATKTDNTSVAVDPGATIMYTIVITNTGTVDLTNVNFTDTVDPNTTLVPGSINSSPIAFDDTYSASGNIPIAPAASLLANDIDPDTGTNAGLTVTQVQGSAGNVGIPTNTTATGIGGVNGSVTVLANGTFTYEPPPGFTGADTFTYQISDAAGKTGSGTVTINISNMVWFIDNTSVAANSRGTFSQPFKTIAAFNAVNSGAAPNPQNGHHVVVRPASGSYAEADGINLRDSQTLTGPAVAFNTVFTADANSSSAYTTFAGSTGTAATITTTAGHGVDLGSGNALRGFNIGNTPGNFGVNGTAVGTLTVATVSKTGTGGAMSVSTSGTFGSTVNFGTFESTSSATNNLNLVGVTGTLGVTSPGTGFTGSAAANAAINISGGSVGFTYAGNVTKATTGALLSVAAAHSGTLTFNTGTLNASSGTGLQFDNADGAYNFNGTTTLNGGDAGIDILNGSGGTFSFGSSTTITSPTGTAFNVGTSPGNPAVTYSGSITQNTAGQRVINIDSTTGNTILFQTGTITGGASSTGVNINAANGNVTFSNGMTMGTIGTRMTNSAVTINNGGSTATYSLGAVSIFTTGAAQGILSTNFDGMLNSASGTVDAAGGAAINIDGPAALTTLGMSLTKVSANGGANGIILTDTSGSFSVVGDGTGTRNNSGGTIQNTTNNGVTLSNVQNISLDHLEIQNTVNSGVAGTLVTNFTYKNSTINNSGTGGGAATSNIAFNTDAAGSENNLNGTVTITNNALTNAFFHGVSVKNFGGTLSDVNVSNNTITSSTLIANSKGSGIQFNALGGPGGGSTASISKATINLNTITNFPSDSGIQVLGGNAVEGGASCTMGTAGNPIAITNNTLSGQSAAVGFGTQGILFNVNGAGTGNFNVSGNSVTNTVGNSISHNVFGDAVVTSVIDGNTVVSHNGFGAAGIAGGTSNTAGFTSTPTLTVTVTNNNVSQTDGNGILMVARDLATGHLNVSIKTNTVAAPLGGVRPGIRVDAGNASGDNDVCLDMSGNTSAGSGGSQGLGLRKQGTDPAVNAFGVEGMAATSSPGVETFVSGLNPAGNGTLLISATSGFTNCSAAPIAPPELSISSVNPITDGEDSAGNGQDPLHAARGEAPKDDDVRKLSPQELTWMAQAAVERWRQIGISLEDIARLQAVSFEIADLPTGQIATSDSTHIKVDETAAGYGWYFDPFPLEDSEYQVLVPNRELQTRDLSPAHGKMDLLSVIMRELGSVYVQGKDRVPKSIRKNIQPLMEGTVSPGVRRLPLDQLRVTPQSQTGSVKPSSDDRQQAATEAATQASAGPNVIEPAANQEGTDNVNVIASTESLPAEARYAVLNSAAGRTVGRGRLRPTPAMIRFNNASDASSYAAIRARRVGTLSPPAGISIGPFTLPVGKSVTIMFNVTVNAANTFPPGTSQVCNQGSITTTQVPGPTLTDDPDVAGTQSTCTTLNVADLSVTKAAGSGTTCSTSNIVYTIGYHNAGPANALAVVVSDPMPAGTSLVSAPAPVNWTRTDSVPVGGNGTIMFARTGPSTNGESATFTVTVSIDGTVADSAVLSNTASVTSTTPDPNSANNTSSPATTVTVKKPPTPATVGGPQTICALGTTTALGGNTPTIGTGTWTVQSGGTGTFNPNATTPGATFTHLTGTGPVVVRWTISNPPCPDSFAEVTITVRAQPTATVGGPQTICALGTTASLGGNTPTPPATGMWSIVTGGVVGTFNPTATTPGATFTHTSGAIGSTVTLRWTVSNAPCTDATADVVVTIKSQPMATAGGPQTICALGTTAALGGNTPAAGETGTWSIVTAGVTGTFNPTANTPGATFTHATGGIATTITLRWTVSNSPCTDATADVAVTIKSQPVATAGGPQTICQGGTTAALGGNTPPVGATGTWSIVTAGVVGTFNPNATTPGATFTHTSGAIGSTVTLRWTVSNAPCTDATADVVVTIKSQPTATAGGPQTICTGGTTASLGGNTPPVGATGTWSIVTAGITGTFNPNVNTPGATFTHSTGATSPFVLRWTVTNAPCTSATADVTITLQPAPISTNGGPQTVCENGTTAGLGGNTPIAGETGTWSIVTGGATGTFTPNATTPNATFSPTSGAGTITLRWTVSNATCGASATSDVIITVKLQPTATVGGPQTICALGTTASLGGNTPAGGGTGLWSIVGGGTGTFNPSATTPGATFTHATGTGPITLRWTVSNAPCANATADVVITITQPPTTATVGGPQTICQSGTTTSLGGNAPTTGMGMWSIQTGGATGTFNPSATTPGATFTPTSGPGTIVVRWTISNPPCTASFAEVTITVKQQPTSTVGGPQTICALGTTANLGGNTPAGGATGLWTVVGGGTGTFNPNATTPGATFTHATGTGPITLRWTVSNAPCTDATADVVITITQSPTPATVGGPQTICALSTTAGLGGNTPTSGTGTWTVQSGGTGTFNPNATTPNATFTHATGTGPIVLRWTIAAAPCPSSFAEVTITITQSPTPATVGGPQTICALSTTAGLGGNAPSSGTGMWTVQSGGAGTFNPNATTANATFTHTSGTGPIVLRWTITNAPCPASFAEVTITITQSPTPATVGGPQTICALSTTVGLGGNTPTSGTGTWTVQSGGAGTFSPNANTGNATFTHTSGAGPIVLRWTIANAPCTASFAEVTITITQGPTPATVGGPQTICQGSATAGLGGNTPSSGTGTWTIQSGGTGTFNPNANTGNATFTPTGGAGTYVVRWTIANAPCPPSFAEVTVTVKLQPTATTSGNQTICALSTTTSLGGNTPAGGATGAWSIVGAGNGMFNPNATTPGATFTHTGGTGPITLRWTVSNAPCTPATADVVLTIKQPPTTATVGGDQTIIPGGTTAPLGGNMPASGTGMWTIATGGFTGTFNPDALTPNATWHHLTGTGQVKLRWTISNSPCLDSFAEVTIQIGVPPMITCPGNITTNAAPGQCSASVSFTVTATGTPSPTIMCKVGATVITSPHTFPVGSTTVTCTASNGVLPDAPCSFVVTVNDTQPPVLTCPAGMILAAKASCPIATGLTVSYTVPVATDNCSSPSQPPTVVCNPPPNSVFPVGTTTVLCTATDPSGNTATCSFTVKVFSFCLQDDSSDANVVFVNALTGEYIFCQNGVTLLANGTGTVVTHGCNFQIDNIKGDRKVHIQGDTAGNSGAGTGTASITKQGGGIVLQITDRKMNNDGCTCSLPPPPAPSK